MRCRSRAVPRAPWTCRVVFKVSTGVRIIRNAAALETPNQLSIDIYLQGNLTIETQRSSWWAMVSFSGTNSIAARQGFRHWLLCRQISKQVLHLEWAYHKFVAKRFTLNKSRSKTLIVSPKSFLVECLARGGEGRSESVLVVHNCSQWLKSISVPTSQKLEASTQDKNMKHTIRSSTCKTIAAAPLRPPPKALKSAFPRSNYRTHIS